jgi:toxin-antitoxin system PIN domain toxin
VIALDTNLLIYAHREEVPFHRAALESLTELVRSRRAWALPWPCVHEFLSTVTNRRVFPEPTPVGLAVESMRELAATDVRLLGEASAHLDILDRLLTTSSVTGPRVHDARIAAICIGHGVSELWTADRDFSYFPEVRTRNPLVGRD